MDDCHGTWFRLCGSCHSEYVVDHANTLRRSAGDLFAYSWPAEEESFVWRHLTNFRLTTLTGEPNHVEIGSLGKNFLLWGGLVRLPGRGHQAAPEQEVLAEAPADPGRLSCAW